MGRHLAYLRYVLRHKWFVFLAGLRLGVPLWQLIIHDWSKFLPGEWMAYARTFYAPDGSKQYDPRPDFDFAWNRHQKRNPHHWQYWLLINDDGSITALMMPDRYQREMLADWIGAGRALGKPHTAAWYATNKHKIPLNPATQRWIEAALLRL